MSKKHRKQTPKAVLLNKHDKEHNTRRNTVALNPLLRKSAVHEKSAKARRQSDKVTLKKTWFERIAA